MRFSSTIDLHLPGEPVRREPSLWDRMKLAFGGAPDLSTGRARLSLEATLLVAELRGALQRLGIGNAISLVVDDHVVFSDPHGRPDDFADLVLALSEHAPVFGAGFQRLRLAVEHEEAGLHYVVEIECATEHAVGEPSAEVRVGARVRDLELSPGESPEGYRQRITPLAQNTALLDTYKKQFDAFVARLADALRAAFPGARALERATEARVVRPTEGAPVPPAPEDPRHPAYDPYARYYPNPLEGMLSGLVLGSLLTSAFRPAGWMVVHPSGAPLASAEELPAHRDELAPDAPDPGDPIATADLGEDERWGDGDGDLGEDQGWGGESDFGDDFGDFGGDF